MTVNDELGESSHGLLKYFPIICLDRW